MTNACSPAAAQPLPRSVRNAGIVAASLLLTASLLLLLVAGTGRASSLPLQLLISRIRALGVTGAACVAVEQLTWRADSHCMLVVARPPDPACLYLNDKQQPGPCNFDASALECTFPAATRMAVHGESGASCTAAAAAAAEAATRAAAGAAQRRAAQPGALPPPAMPLQPPRLRVHPSAPGSWGTPQSGAAAGWQPGVVFRPADDAACPPSVTGAAGLVGWARATGIRRIVMCGDSTMRQFFQRVATLARGERVTVDVVSQRYAHYSLGWGEGDPGTLRDTLWFSPDAYPPALRGDGGAIAARLAAAHAALAARSARDVPLPPGMESRELTVDLVMGTYKFHMQPNVEAYVRDMAPAWQDTAIVLSVCYWHTADGDADVWPDWWAWVGSLRAAARRVVVLTCPTPPALGTARVLQARNAHLRSLFAVAEEEAGSATDGGDKDGEGSATDGGGGDKDGEGSGGEGGAAAPLGTLQLLDAAAILESLPESESKGPEDAHFQCGFYTTNEGAEGPVENTLFDGASTAYRFFDVVRVDRGGTCADAANFALWQALLCLLAA